MAYLDNNGLTYLWSKIKAAFAAKSEGVKTITRSGTTFTVTRADDTTFTFSQQDNTVAKTTTTPKANGTAAIGSETKYAAGDHVHPLQTTVSGNAGTATKLETARTVDGVSFDGSANIVHFGSCSTAAATVGKSVSCTGFTLATGAWVAVKFTVTNTGAVASLTLDVNSTGAKSIKYRGGNLPSAGTLAANRTYLFVYDGTNYELIGDLDTNTTYSAMTSEIAQAGTEATAKTISASVLNSAITSKGYTTNTGTVTSVATGAGLTGGTITGSGTIKVDLVSETKLTNAAAAATETSGRVYPVALDKNGDLAVNVPWTDNDTTALGSMTGTLGVAHGGTGVATLGAGVVYHSASGTGAMSIASAANLVSALGTTAVNRATADASGNNIADTYAKKTDIASMYKYKGSVASAAALPSSGQTTGDVYNIETASVYGAAGANVAWNGSAWDSLGEIFSITAISNAEIDTIVAA